jgi:hypothetical protein
VKNRGRWVEYQHLLVEKVELDLLADLERDMLWAETEGEAGRLFTLTKCGHRSEPTNSELGQLSSSAA